MLRERAGAQTAGTPPSRCKQLIFLPIRERRICANPGQRYPSYFAAPSFAPVGNRKKLGSRVQWMRGLLEELVLQLKTFLVSLDRSDRLCDVVDPHLHSVLAHFKRGGRTVAGVMIGKARVPPDSCIEVLGQLLPCLI